MNELENIYSVLAEINKVLGNKLLQNEIQTLTIYLNSLQQNQQIGLNPNAIQNQQIGRNIPSLQNQNISLSQIVSSLDKIIEIIGSISTALLTAEHEFILEKLGLSNLIGEKGKNHFENIKFQIQNNSPSTSNLLQTTIIELNILRTKPNQFLNLLQTFDFKSNIQLLNEDEGIIEILFDGGVAIDDFKEAKDQMNDWFFIIEGYSRLLGVTREDFEIINISKNSPVKFKLKTTLNNTALFLSIITSVLLIEKTVLENKLIIEQLKHNNLVPDAEVQKEFIESAEKNIDAKIEVGINSIISQKLLEYKIPKNNGDIATNLKKGVQNQYNFVVNGGIVNVYVLDGEIKKDVVLLEKTKEELKLIRDAYENQKSLTSGKNNENENVEEQTTE